MRLVTQCCCVHWQSTTLCVPTPTNQFRDPSHFGRPRFAVHVNCFRICQPICSCASSIASACSLCFAAATFIDAKADSSAADKISGSPYSSSASCEPEDLQEEPRSRSCCSPSLPHPPGPCYPTRLEPLLQQNLLLLTNRTRQRQKRLRQRGCPYQRPCQRSFQRPEQPQCLDCLGRAGRASTCVTKSRNAVRSVICVTKW